MRLFKTIFLLSFILLFAGSCKKEHEYRINIANKTNCQINKLVVKGESDYIFNIEKGGETGEFVFEWKGSTKHWFAGFYPFYYYVESFIDEDSTLVTSQSCNSGISVDDLSTENLNKLQLTKEITGDSICKHSFRIDFE